MNIGEELVGDYLQYIEGCEFVQKNLSTKDIQGEIDVIDINLEQKTVYLCEVAIHLETGLQYTFNKRPNNVNKLTEKFSKDIQYALKYFPTESEYQHKFMFWSPIVKKRKSSAKNDQDNNLKDVQGNIRKKYGIEIELIINKAFMDAMGKLRQFALNQTGELKSPVLRLYQIEEKTQRYIQKHRFTNLIE